MPNQTKISFWDQSVSQVPQQAAAFVKKGTTIKEVVALMQQKNIGCVLVSGENDEIAGVVTIGDLMQTFVGSTLSADASIDNIMTTTVRKIDQNSSVLDTVDTFYHEKLRHLPVLSADNKVSGILSDRNLMNYIAENMPSEVLNLPPDSSISSTDTAGG